MGEKRIKEKAELGVGGYFKRIFAFWGVVVLGVCLSFGAAILAAKSGASSATIQAIGGLCALAYFGTHIAIWLFPAFCVDVLKPRPISATTTSVFTVLVFGVATSLYIPSLRLESGWERNGIFALVYGI